MVRVVKPNTEEMKEWGDTPMERMLHDLINDRKNIYLVKYSYEIPEPEIILHSGRKTPSKQEKKVIVQPVAVFSKLEIGYYIVIMKGEGFKNIINHVKHLDDLRRHKYVDDQLDEIIEKYLNIKTKSVRDADGSNIRLSFKIPITFRHNLERVVTEIYKLKQKDENYCFVGDVDLDLRLDDYLEKDTEFDLRPPEVRRKIERRRGQ